MKRSSLAKWQLPEAKLNELIKKASVTLGRAAGALSVIVSAYQIMNSSSGLRKTPTWTQGDLITAFLSIDPFSMFETNKKGWERDLEMGIEPSEEK